MFEGIRPEAAHVGFEISGSRVIRREEDATLVTTDTTRARITVRAESCNLWFDPPLLFLVHPPWFGALVEDVRWRGAEYRFGGPTTARLERVPAWFAFDMASGTVQQRIEESISGLFAGTPFASRSYRPFDDAELSRNLATLEARLRGSGGGGSGPTVEPQSAGADVTLLDGLIHREGDALIRIRPGTRVRVLVGLGAPGDPQRLVGIRRASVDFQPPLEIESGEVLLGLRRFDLEVESCGPVVRIDPSDVTFLRHSGGSAVGTLIVGVVGALAAARSGGRTTDHIVQGLAVGTRAMQGGAADLLSRRFTVAAGLLLEQARPRLKEVAPLVDWDALLCTSDRRPALARPLQHAR